MVQSFKHSIVYKPEKKNLERKGQSQTWKNISTHTTYKRLVFRTTAAKNAAIEETGLV